MTKDKEEQGQTLTRKEMEDKGGSINSKGIIVDSESGDYILSSSGDRQYLSLSENEVNFDLTEYLLDRISEEMGDSILKNNLLSMYDEGSSGETHLVSVDSLVMRVIGAMDEEMDELSKEMNTNSFTQNISTMIINDPNPIRNKIKEYYATSKSWNLMPNQISEVQHKLEKTIGEIGKINSKSAKKSNMVLEVDPIFYSVELDISENSEGFIEQVNEIKSVEEANWLREEYQDLLAASTKSSTNVFSKVLIPYVNAKISELEGVSLGKDFAEQLRDANKIIQSENFIGIVPENVMDEIRNLNKAYPETDNELLNENANFEEVWQKYHVTLAELSTRMNRGVLTHEERLRIDSEKDMAEEQLVLLIGRSRTNPEAAKIVLSLIEYGTRSEFEEIMDTVSPATSIEKLKKVNATAQTTKKSKDIILDLVKNSKQPNISSNR